MRKRSVQIREKSKGMKMTWKFPLRQMDGQLCHKLNKVMDAGGGASQINNKHMIFCHKLGKFTFKRLVHLVKCYCLKLPSPYLHNWNPLVIFFTGHSVTIQEFESLHSFDFAVYQNGILFTKS